MINLPLRNKFTWVSFQGKIRLGFIFIALMLLGLSALIAYYWNGALKENQYIQDTISPIKVQSYLLLASVNKATTHINRYAINSSLEEYKDALFEINNISQHAVDSLTTLSKILREDNDGAALVQNISDIKESFEKLKSDYELLSSFDEAEQKGLILGTLPRDMNFLDRYISELVDNRIRDMEELKGYRMSWDIRTVVDGAPSMIFSILVVIVGIIIGVIIVTSVLIQDFLTQIDKIHEYTHSLAIGHISAPANHYKDEFGYVLKELNILNQELKNVKAFAKDVGQEKFDTDIKVFHNSDDLGEALEAMRQSLREINDKEELRTWQLNGINSLAEVIRTSTREIESFCDVFLFHLIQYSELNQGAIYLYNKEKNVLDMKACFAYGRKKYIKQEIEYGHGVVGEVFRDGATVIMTDIPDNYMRIQTGLGEAPPKSLAVVPLMYQEQKLGVIELAAFHEYSATEKELFEQVSEIFTANLLNAINTNRTEELLKEATEATQKLNAQEEELRQNAEELLAMREGLERRNQLLEEELELFKAIVRNDHIPVVQTDYHGNILTSSGAFMRLLKDVEGDIHNVNVLEIMPSLKALYENTDAITTSNYLQTHKIRLKSGEFMEVRTAVNRAKVHGITRFEISILNHVDQHQSID